MTVKLSFRDSVMAASTRIAPAAPLALLLLAGASLGACSSVQPHLSNRLPAGSALGAPTAVAGRPAEATAGGVYKVGAPYQVGGVWYVPREQPDYDETGTASWYGDEFQLQPTANGETFDRYLPSAAHPTLPLPSIVEVTNLSNGRKIQVRVNDRGPFVGGRIIDLSHEAARQLGYDAAGLAPVRVRYVGLAPLNTSGLRLAQAGPVAPSAPAVIKAAVPVQPVSYSAPVKAPTPVVTASLAAPSPAIPASPPSVAGTPSYALYRVQAGAFSDPANAERVIGRLAPAGRAVVEPMIRDGVTLYRVVLTGGADEGAAWALREQVASLGFEDARVITPF